MHRFFSDKKEDNYLYILDKEDIKHFKVLRIKENEKIEVIFKSILYICVIASFELEYIKLEIIEEIIKDTSTNITLIQSSLKGTKIETVLSHSTELGVNKFIIVNAKRTVAKYNIKKIDRYKKIIKASSKQSKRFSIPSLEFKNSFDEIDFSAYDKLIVLNEKEKTKRIGVYKGNVALIVGPEGGLSEDELKYFLSFKNSKSVKINNNILRAETASLTALSILVNNMEFMDEN